jgi:hypothetical protein
VFPPLIPSHLAQQPREPVSASTAGHPPHRRRRSSPVRPHTEPSTDDVAPPTDPPLYEQPERAWCDVPNCAGHRTRA